MQLRQNNAGTINDSTAYNVGDQLFIVISYTFGPGTGDDQAKMWINPTSNFGAATPPAATLSTIGNDIAGSLTSFILREGNGAIPKSISVDELRIDPSWAQVTMPAGNSWIGASGASWSTDGNWSSGTHPNAASSFVNFFGAGGSVVVDSPQTIGCMNIQNTSGYTVSGATLTFDSGGTAELGATAINVMAVMDPVGPGLVLSGSHTISAPITLNNTLSTNIASGQTLTLSGGVSGTAGLIKEGAGTLVLSTSNSYAGNTTLGNGTVVIGDPNALSTGSVTFTGSTLRASTNVTVGNPIILSTVGPGTGTVDTGTNLVTLSGTISGGASLNKIGAGTLILSGTANSYGNTLVRAGTLRISAPTNLGAGTNLSLAGGALQTDAAMTLIQNLIISNTGTFDTHGFNTTLNPGAHITGTGNFHEIGGGVLTTNGVGTVTNGTAGFIGGLTIDAGTLAVASGRDASGKITHTAALSVASGAALDLNDNDLVYNYSNGGAPDATRLATVQQLASIGYAGGAWTGAGITSGVAKSVAADGTNSHKTALGFAEASAAGISGFDGVTTDGDMILIRYTYGGDSNLDGQVTSTDFDAVSLHFNQSGQTWVTGDFNFDGIVNALDFNAVATNYGAAQINSQALGAVVPEPSAALLCLALPLLGCRRRARV
jgi:autotransporter-associated beta strand protein